MRLPAEQPARCQPFRIASRNGGKAQELSMKNMTRNTLLAAGLFALVVPVFAQDNAKSTTPAGAKTSAPKPAAPRKKAQAKHVARATRKQTVGEAASLEKKEAGLNTEERDMRDDNRGRLTSANRAKLQHRHAATAANHHKHPAAVANASTAGKHAASLKTGQLTSGGTAHLETKETSLHHEIHSDREETGQAAPQPDKTTNQIHLKKHNARMF
jgi:hypothetical protein